MAILKLRNEIMGKLRQSKSAKTLLATSPVIKMNDALCEAEAFISINALEECGIGEIQSTRGSLVLTLQKQNGEWEVTESHWYNYAMLEPWPENPVPTGGKS